MSNNGLSKPRKTLKMAATAIAALTLGANLVGAAERLPQFDLVQVCKSGGALWGTSRQASESCVRSEQEARTTLEKSWNEIVLDDRKNCSLLVSTGGPPSYVELLSCVEMARQARAYRDQRTKHAAEPPAVAIAPAPRKVPQSKQPRLERDVGTTRLEAAS